MSSKAVAPPQPEKAVPSRTFRLPREIGILGALGLMVLVLAVFIPQFRDLQNIINITRNFSFVGIVAMGMTLVILTETALFTIFVVAYLFYIGKSVSGPYPHEVLELPILGTVLLLSSSATIVVAERNLHKGIDSLFNLWWSITALLGFGFLIYTGVEWHKLIYEDHLTISTNLFGSTFYSLVGLHASHVVVGLILILMILIFNVTGRIKHYHHEHIIMISWY